MTAQSMSVPITVFVILATYQLLHYQVENQICVFGLSIAISICLTYILIGVDILTNRKKDNPGPVPIPKSIDEAFGVIQERIKETNVGPFWWSIRTASQEESRILASLSFTETYPSLTGAPQQLQRMIVLAAKLVDLPEDEQKPESEALANLGVNTPTLLTSMELNWSVDSPANRTKCNEIIDDMTYDLKNALGVSLLPKPEERHPLEPPAWAIMVLMIAIFMTAISYFESKEYRRQMEEQIRVENLQKSLDGRAWNE